MLPDPTPSDALKSHPPSTAEASEKEMGQDSIDVIPGEEWDESVEVATQAVDILDRRMNLANDKFKTLEDFTLDETESTQKEFEGRPAGRD